ncbi:hypothetical protein JZ751_011667 [Albula glossodonta]|uniref:Scavenger receptor class B member 1 n=1 Tax=Albula glossodonta TaxID=121402 RepID=A0A8T2PQD9_9TELE|nr:hypothetical protein JZ751_011667 [Albula glossodonta]
MSKYRYKAAHTFSSANVEINPKNELSYTMWKDIPVPFFMSVYFFHVLNPNEILLGEKPMLEQRGPYVYNAESVHGWGLRRSESHSLSFRRAVFPPDFSSSPLCGNFTSLTQQTYRPKCVCLTLRDSSMADLEPDPTAPTSPLLQLASCQGVSSIAT